MFQRCLTPSTVSVVMLRNAMAYKLRFMPEHKELPRHFKEECRRRTFTGRHLKSFACRDAGYHGGVDGLG